MSFDTPLWLLALPLAAVPWVVTRPTAALREARARRSDRPRDRGPHGRGPHGRGPHGRGLQGRGLQGRGHRTARWLRTVALLAVVLALAGPRVRTGGGGVDVAFLLDRSDSTATARSASLEHLERALAARPDGARAAVGVFGRDAQLVSGLADDPSADEPANVVDGAATDLQRALRLGQGAVGSDRQRRVVVITDGRQTTGDLEVAAEEMAAAGVGLDVVTVGGADAADVLVDRVDGPSEVRRGEAYDVTVRLRNTGDAPLDATVVVDADDERVDQRAVALSPGVTEVVVPAVAGAPGTVRYEARLESPGSTVAANDVARAAVRTAGPPRVLVFERTDGLGRELTRALEASDIGVDVARADQDPLPSLDRLTDYDSVVLVDVAATDLGDGGVQTLETFVRDAGHGLVAIGGEASFGLGAYDGTPLEEVLPVFGQVTDPQRRPPLAEALVVDTSESMTACHCADDQTMGGGDGFQEGGVNKTDISKEAVARAVDALEAEDTLGVLAFNRSNDWVVPLQRLPSADVIDRGLAQIHPRGDTAIAQAVREAMDGLADTDARLRHIVLFTDGFTAESADGLVDIAAEAADAGITLSVVGTGEGPADLQRTLERMAEAGGGRYYPGRDLQSVPNIIALELRTAARNIVTEGQFVPTITGVAPATADLDATPPLLGYLATTAKPTARTLLRIGEERDPLLATWDVGLGTSTAWMSDATSRWSAGWVDWDGYASFWSAVVRDTFPTTGDDRAQVTATVGGDGIDIAVDTADELPVDAQATATVAGPDGTRQDVALERTGLRSYAATVDAGATGLSDDGVYVVSTQIDAGDDKPVRATTTAIRSYPAEYAAGDGDPDLLTRATAADTARLDPPAEQSFDTAGLPAGDARTPLWPWLLLLALVLTPIDVGLRRLRLERADLDRVLEPLRRRVGTRRPHERTSRSTARSARHADRTTAPPPDRATDTGAGHRPPAPSGERSPASGSARAGGATTAPADDTEDAQDERAEDTTVPDQPDETLPAARDAATEALFAAKRRATRRRDDR